MRRRQFIAGTAATATMGFARTVYAETNARPTGIKRVAVFHPTDPHPLEGLTINGRRGYKAYFDELNRLGYIEGQNLIVERYSALGHLDRIRDLAREIVASHPDVILPFSGPFLNELMALNTNIPMVGPTADPIPFGWTTSLARPDRNFTGAVIDAGLEIWAKRFQLLLESARKLTKVGFLAANPPHGPPSQSAHVRDAAHQAGIKVAVIVVGGEFFDRAVYERTFDTVIVVGENVDRAGYGRAFDLIEKDGVDGIVASDSSEHFTYREVIVDLAARFRMPAIYPAREFVDVGGLMAYGYDTLEEWRRIADMTAQVLRGTKPSELPFYRLTKYELVLNQKAATSLGLEFPATLLATADEVIE